MSSLSGIKIIFFGTSRFAVPALEALSQAADVVAVVTQPDAHVGRRQELQAPPVAQWVRAHAPHIPLVQPPSLKEEAVVAELASYGADCAVVAAYGKIIPSPVLQLFPRGCLNIHGSVLPDYRGASPIHAALRDGREVTGNTIMLMDEQMDHGPILTQSSVPIHAIDTFAELEARMAQDGARLLMETLPGHLDGTIEPQEQDHTTATYVSLLRKEDGLITPEMTVVQIRNAWRAYRAWPQIHTTYTDNHGVTRRLVINDIDEFPGMQKMEQLGVQCLANTLIFACADGALTLRTVTPEGKKQMSGSALCNGMRGA